MAVAPHDEYVEEITSAGFRFIPIDIDRRGTNPLVETFLIIRYCRIISVECPDVVLTYTPKPNIYASLAARRYGVPVINNISGLGFIFIKGGTKASIVRLLYRIALSYSHQIFFQNQDDQEEFVNGGLVRPDKIALLPGSGVDVSRFAPQEPSRIDGRVTFLLIARMLWDKGVGEFVDAATQLHSRYPDLRFLLLGPPDQGNPAGIPLETLQQWNRGGIITWLGSMDDIRDIIANSDCVVLPSYREGMPRTLLEAASMAKPVITTDEPGCREAVIDGVTGFLCRSRDVADLAAKMEQMLILLPEERTAMGMAGRERMVRKFNEQYVIDRYLAAVREHLSSNI